MRKSAFERSGSLFGFGWSSLCTEVSCLALFCFLGSGVSHVLTLALQELSLLCKRDVNGVGMLYDLLRSRWLQALLKVRYHTAGKAKVTYGTISREQLLDFATSGQ